MNCKHCAATTRQIKYGKTTAGKQRYKCKICNRTYTLPNVVHLLRDHFTSLEICAGAGGQALGLEEAGFEHIALVEIDKKACATLRHNRPQWQVIETDVRQFDATPYRGQVDLLSGGIPCPPFSVAGKQLGADDERNLFDDVIRLTREIQPKAIMVENVRGLLDKTFDGLREEVTSAFKMMGYQVFWRLLQASDYGVPQLRPRTIMIALLPAYSAYFSWPQPVSDTAPTVGEALIEEMAANGWQNANTWKQQANQVAPTLVGGSKKHGGPDLGPTRAKRAWAKLGVNGNKLADEAPGPDFDGMPHLTVRMAAILQGFPTTWDFVGRKTAAYRQVGNAFPPPVAAAIGKQITSALRMEKRREDDEGVTVVWQRKLALEVG